MFIPRKIYNYDGFDYIVPVVVSEKNDLSNQIGLLVNRGFMPHEYKSVANWFWVEDSFSKFEFVGMVTRGEDLVQNKLWRRGNVVDE